MQEKMGGWWKGLSIFEDVKRSVMANLVEMEKRHYSPQADIQCIHKDKLSPYKSNE